MSMQGWGWICSRRTRACVASLALLAACGGSPTGGAGTPADTTTKFTRPALLGADVSALARIEQAGGVFRDGGQAGDALAILRAHGSDIFRLRLFVSPNYTEVQVNDLPYTIALAKRVKATGAKLLLDFHYSDTWADPGHQVTPAAWQGLGYDSLAQRVKAYSADVIAQLKAAGALPDIVQIGNEVDAGMLWPLGQLNTGTADEWTRFTGLLKAGVEGVKSALGPADAVRIMLQYSQGGSSGGTQWFFDHVDAAGVPYDIIGLSYYPWWHGSIGQLEANLQATEARYHRDIMVVETSYPWRAGGWESMGTNQAAMTWAATPAGQKQFLHDLVAAVGAVPGSHGLGVVWWYPEAIQVPGVSIWGGGSLSLFDASGNLLPAASIFAH